MAVTTTTADTAPCADCGGDHTPRQAQALSLRPCSLYQPAKDHADAPLELSEFIVHVKAMGVRTYKGEFITSAGERIAINELTFERAGTQRSSDG